MRPASHYELTIAELESVNESLSVILHTLQTAMDEGYDNKTNRGTAMGLHTAKAIVTGRIHSMKSRVAFANEIARKAAS